MSSSKLDTSGVFQPVKVESHETQLTLHPDAVRIHKSGIEFRTAQALPCWSEMTVELLSPGESRKVRFNGVVVACHGNRHAGYVVSLVFTSISRQSQERLGQLAEARLG